MIMIAVFSDVYYSSINLLGEDTFLAVWDSIWFLLTILMLLSPTGIVVMFSNQLVKEMLTTTHDISFLFKYYYIFLFYFTLYII